MSPGALTKGCCSRGEAREMSQGALCGEPRQRRGAFQFWGILENETEVHGTVRGVHAADPSWMVPRPSALMWASVSCSLANLAMFPSIYTMKLRKQCSLNFLHRFQKGELSKLTAVPGICDKTVARLSSFTCPPCRRLNLVPTSPGPARTPNRAG